MSEKLALITGGSRGIGKACAIELAKAGYDIVINYAGNDAAAQQAVEEIQTYNVNADAYKFDVSNKEAVEKSIAEIIEKHGRIDVFDNSRSENCTVKLIKLAAEQR